ncbi:MAG: hypothetical protein JWM57_3891, partial [Phycisphaerales bacterium]|nr:hypothetical protein [Phycisphaerales bacterium]
PSGNVPATRGNTAEPPAQPRLNVDNTGVTSKPIGDGEDAHLAGNSPDVPL